MQLAPSFAIFRHRAYLQFLIARQLLVFARHMETLAIGWQVYDMARQDRGIGESALLLGFVGLVQFLPVLILSLVGGQAADRFDRRTILLCTNSLRLMATLVLLASTRMSPDVAMPMIFTVAAMLGVANAFTPAAANALYPTLVPRDELPTAIAWNSLAATSGAIAGPAIAGLLYISGPGTVYVAAACMIAGALFLLTILRPPVQVSRGAQRGVAMIVDGLRYVAGNKVVLGAISLDLVVYFFGGVTALLPIYARDILHVGTEGLGILRAAPALGGGIVAAVLAWRPMRRHAGRWMMGGVAAFGLSTIVFGLSQSYILSLCALAIGGAGDMLSVYVRNSLIQLATPDHLRGRVSSVSFICISASNELGEFESGLATWAIGPVGAAVAGGVIAVATPFIWTRLFPALWRADRFELVEETPPASTPGIRR